MNKLTLSTLICAAAFALAACEKKGPVEQTGEEIDEAVDTIKNGGKESTENKADDAMDDLRKGAENAKEEIRH